MAVRLNEWFCLNPGRDNFKPNNITDAELIFCHEHLVHEEILGSIERRFAGNEPVKMLMFGDWGVGKTHTINHICRWLAKNKEDYPAHPVTIDIGDISKTTKFDAIVRPFLDELGTDFLVNLVHQYVAKRPAVVPSLEKAGVSIHVAEAFGKLLLAPPGGTPPQVVNFAMQYLRGDKVPSQATAMGFSQRITDSKNFFDILNAIGEMFLTVHGYRMLFIADEAAKLETIDSDDATYAHWVNANKLIFDDNNRTFGFIYTVSGRRQHLPRALMEPQILNRLGRNVFELMNLEPRDVSAFLDRLRESFVDRSQVEKLVQEGLVDAQNYSWAQYPFTADGREGFVDYFDRTQEDSKPRDISGKLNDAGFVAAKLGRRLIDRECLEKAQM